MSSATTKGSTTLRKDIQALRAIAITPVVLFHLWPARISGGFVGVDVFFVISGFLITSHMLREVENNSFKISDFWVRRVRRLLPASFTVLLATALSVIALVPVQLWLQWLKEIQASILYFENWILALDAVDYLALSNEPSPVQHFWSLSVEEQFYLVWPLLIASAIFLVRKTDWKSRRSAILALLLLLTVSSFGYGVYLTQTEPAIAYFSTPVRAWEFGVGALIAFAPAIRNATAKWIASIFGLALIAYSSFAYSTELAFPGYWALIPVLGAAAVIWGSSNDGALGRVFALKPLQWLGTQSYSIYLWHWPIVTLLPYALGADLDTLGKIFALALTLLLAKVTTAFIERPFLAGGRVPRFKPATVFASLIIVSLILVGSAAVGIEQAKASIEAEKKKTDAQFNGVIDCFGAGARAPGKEACTNPKLKELFPPLASAAADSFWPEGCPTETREDVQPSFCEVGNGKSEIRIALVGDSHAKQYAAAFRDLAAQNNWSVEIFVKGGCPFSKASRIREDSVLTEACNKYVDNVEKIILKKQYDLVITSQRNGVAWIPTNNQSQEETAIAGLKATWSSLVAKGIPVLAIKDSPMPVPKVIRCLEIKTLKECSPRRSEAFLFDPQVQASKRSGSDLVRLVEFDDIYCNSSVCFPVIGNVVVYRDENHLTSTFTRTLARFLKPHIEEALVK
jgi:peptidoglycan/LPS O-acetylase OafA/YrhL